MKILYQWALKNPTGWQEVDSSQWSSLPKRPLPKPGQLGGLSNVPGWIRNVNVQGITNEGFDHVAIEEVIIGNDIGVKMTSWNDDPNDLVPGNEPQAIVWTILPLAPDPKHGMAINTRQSCVRYHLGEKYDQLVANIPQNTTVRPWTEFVAPPEIITRHGVWLEDSKHQEHIDKAPHAEWGWMHWNEHLPDSECELDAKGRRILKEQRKQGRYHQAEHTITYYQRSTARAVGVSVAYNNENALEKTTAVSSTQSVTVDNVARIACWIFTTPANEPNSGDWPSGIFNEQINCTTVSAGVTYGNHNVATGYNGFLRLNSGLTSYLDSKLSSGANLQFSGTGLKLMSSLTWDSAAGNTTDVYSTTIIAGGSSHGDSITITLNTTDSYADGPWSSGPPPADPVPYTNPNLQALLSMGVGI